jgi:hypothetical protein
MKTIKREIKNKWGVVLKTEIIKELTKADLIKEIRRQHRKNFNIGFLGFIENKNLSVEVEDYFNFKNNFGVAVGYDWVNGNENLKELIKEVLK